MVPEDIILKPVLTEKGYDGIADKRYTFTVAKAANKTQIKIAVEKMFGVRVAERQHGHLPRQAQENGQERGLYARRRKRRSCSLRRIPRPSSTSTRYRNSGG